MSLSAGFKNIAVCCSHFAYLIPTFLLTSTVLAQQSSAPSVSGNVLHLPVVVVDDRILDINFEIVELEGSIQLNLMSALDLSDVDTTGAASYYCIPFTFNCFLNIPELMINGDSLWGEFQITSIEPVTFQLSATDLNRPGESGFEGKWRYSTVNVTQNCGDPIPTKYSNFTVRASADQFLIDNTLAATRSGNTLEWSGTTPDGFGTVTFTSRMTFDPASGTGTGTSEWVFNQSGFSCSGQHEHSATLLHN